ncbi:MAG TPA: GspMb/PilO family protein [Dehalococcoidales bacterium]|nr:MAG: hypothetical protein A2Z05_04955 [Chloroflexi bacterium RBG_16_60_22]HJX14014.1 GspMb/PilO family protein [Dehalococcoidales bacterium]
MKTRKTLMVILAVVLLAGYYLSGTEYLKQRRERAALEGQIAGTARTLAEIPPTPPDLDGRLIKAEADLEAARSSFPAGRNTTVVVNAVLRLAERVGIRALPLVTQPWTTEGVSDDAYAVFRLNVTATGSFDLLSEFLNGLESGAPETLVIESLTVDRESGTPQGNAAVKAWIDIAVYARSPAGG